MLPYFRKPVALDAFIGAPPDRAERVRRFHAAWDRIDAALDRNKRRG